VHEFLPKQFSRSGMDTESFFINDFFFVLEVQRTFVHCVLIVRLVSAFFKFITKWGKKENGIRRCRWRRTLKFVYIYIDFDDRSTPLGCCVIL